MLAYVFWHWKQASISVDDYEQRQRAFQQSLVQHKPTGFLASSVFALTGVPWANSGQDAYEDWYVLDGSASLDVLNDAAIAPPHRETHDQAAHAAAGGTAGLYRLRIGEPLGAKIHTALWFNKPDNMRYEELFSIFKDMSATTPLALWGRQMTLGPSTEFCVHLGASAAVHWDASPRFDIKLRPVWA